MLRRFSSRREAVPESVAAKSLGRTRPVQITNATAVFAGHAIPLSPKPTGKSRKPSKTSAVEGTRRRLSHPCPSGELL